MSVLLARPHQQIVEHMKPFIAGMGLAPRAVDVLSEIGGARTGDLCGAVISTAARSKIPVTYVEVLQLIREHHPDLPILFATIADARVIAVNLESITRRLFGAGEVALTAEIDRRDRRLGSRNLYLLVTRAELITEAERDRARAAVLRHFGTAE